MDALLFQGGGVEAVADPESPQYTPRTGTRRIPYSLPFDIPSDILDGDECPALSHESA